MTALKAAKPESCIASSAVALILGAMTAGSGLSSCIYIICWEAFHERDSSMLSPQGYIWPAVLPLEDCQPASASKLTWASPGPTTPLGPVWPPA